MWHPLALTIDAHDTHYILLQPTSPGDAPNHYLKSTNHPQPHMAKNGAASNLLANSIQKNAMSRWW